MALCCKHSAAVQEGAGKRERERAMAHPPPSPFSSCSRTHDASFRMGSARPLSRGGVTPLPTPFRALRRRPKGSLATGLATEHVAFPRSRLSCCQAREGEAPNKRAAALCSSLQEEPLWAMVNLDVCVRVHMFVCVSVRVCECVRTHTHHPHHHMHTHTHIYVFGLIRFAWLSRRLPSYVTLSITDRALGLYLRQRRTTTRAWACVCVCVCVTHCHLVSELQKCARVHALPWLRIVPIPALQCILTMSGCPHTCVCVCVGFGSSLRPPPRGGRPRGW